MGRMDRSRFNNSDHGIRCGNMRDEADAGVEESKKEENRRERRDEWRELLQQAESRSQDDIADCTSADSPSNTTDGQWCARI